MIIFPKFYWSHSHPIFGTFPHGWKLPSWERLPAHDTVLPNLWAAGIWPQVVFFSLGVFPPFFGEKKHRSAKRYPYHSYTMRPMALAKENHVFFWGFVSIHTSTNSGMVWRFAKAKSLGPPRSAHANSLGGRSVGSIHRKWFNNENLRNETYIHNA